MKKMGFGLMVLMLVSALAACEKESPEVDQPEGESTPESGQVEVTAEGSEFDPPVAIEQMPDGAWYCDMGTVHYARMEQGDGTCAICGMTLVQNSAAQPEPTPTEAAPTEAAPTEAAPTEAAPTEAAPTEAPTTEPVPTEAPAPSGDAPTEPATTQPM